MLVLVVCFLACLQQAVCFITLHPAPMKALSLSAVHPFYSIETLYNNIGSMILSDTSLSEEDVLDVVGQTADLPDPLIVIGLAAVVVLGVGVLQFSLGDLTKEVSILFHIFIDNLVIQRDYNRRDKLGCVISFRLGVIRSVSVVILTTKSFSVEMIFLFC